MSSQEALPPNQEHLPPSLAASDSNERTAGEVAAAAAAATSAATAASTISRSIPGKATEHEPEQVEPSTLADDQDDIAAQTAAAAAAEAAGVAPGPLEDKKSDIDGEHQMHTAHAGDTGLTPPRATAIAHPHPMPGNSQIPSSQQNSAALTHVPNMPSIASPIQKKQTGSSPYICDVIGCGKAFGKKFNLKAHKRVHTGEQPFVCSFPGCGKTFKWKSSLTFHEGLHLNAPEEAPQPQQPPPPELAGVPSGVSANKKVNKV